MLASVSLFYAVSHWNSYFNAMLYINNSDMEVITIVLRRLVFLTTQVWRIPPLTGSGRYAAHQGCQDGHHGAVFRPISASIRFAEVLTKVSWSARSRADTKQYNHFLYKKEKTK